MFFIAGRREAGRHASDAHSGEQTPFRSGYVNVICEDDG